MGISKIIERLCLLRRTEKNEGLGQEVAFSGDTVRFHDSLMYRGSCLSAHLV